MLSPQISLISKLLTVSFLSILCLVSSAENNTENNNVAENSPSNSKLKYSKAIEDLIKPEEYQGNLQSLSSVNIRNAHLELITDQLIKPWAFEFISNEQLIISEIGGGIKILNINDKTITPLTNIPHIITNNSQIGLLDIEIHPDFKENQKIYFSYSKYDKNADKYFSLAVSSANIVDNRLENITTIFDSNPFTWSPSNFGGALEFDDKGLLYIATGDRSESKSAQNTGILQGKILRVNDDGTAAKNNPFEKFKNIDNRIFSIGVRNPQGLHFDPVNKILFEAEHGPMGGDEVNIIKAGANYGWPAVSYGISYTTHPIGDGTHHESMTQPIYYYLPSIAISPLTVYRGSMFHEWEGDLLVGALKGNHVSKIDYDEGVIRSESTVLTEIKDRIRDIKVAHDGSIYVLSQKGKINRLFRETSKKTPVEDNTAGSLVYEMACSGCHDNGAYESPVLGNSSQWKKIIEQPLSLTYKHTIEGKNLMPPRGYCNICTDKHLKRAVNYMLEQVQE